MRDTSRPARREEIMAVAWARLETEAARCVEVLGEHHREGRLCDACRAVVHQTVALAAIRSAGAVLQMAELERAAARVSSTGADVLAGVRGLTLDEQAVVSGVKAAPRERASHGRRDVQDEEVSS
jgi:hypothetical protein